MTAPNFERRRRVMARSRKLGHCVCNPRNPCPCPIFIDQNLCPCAGERPGVSEGPVALTRLVRKAGCASKIGQADLARILKGLPDVTDPNVLLGVAAGDDAGVYRLSDDLALVQTVDVFTPCVDDARLFGRIAAANSLSDVYAMGGRPLTALSIVGFPIDDRDGAILTEILAGGMETLEVAGCALIGGHSINDEEIKCGFAITGAIDPRRQVARAGARPGDVLVLTKPLGTGMLAFAAQLGRVGPQALAEAGATMATLNRDAAELMVAHGASACTDVTGFGLAGHLVEMARGSAVAVEVDLSALPVFAAVRQCIDQDILSGAIERNQEYAMAWVRLPEEASDGADGAGCGDGIILYDPQTSGGLLIALSESAASAFVADMADRGHRDVAIIGRVLEPRPGALPAGVLSVINPRLARFVGTADVAPDAPGAEPTETSPMPDPTPPVASSASVHADGPEGSANGGDGDPFACCAGGGAPEVTDASGGVTSAAAGDQSAGAPDSADALDAFMAFMKAANAPGAIDGPSKKLMAIALSVAMRCRPCTVAQVRGALAMGLSPEAIHEAANLAISFAGCPAMMQFKEICEELRI